MIHTNKNKITSLLKYLKIKKGSYVIIHCSSFMFGKIDGGIKTLYGTIRNNLGVENTLIYPSFTYSYRRNKVFDILKTPSDSEIGLLSEEARKDPMSYRNNDPLFSLVSSGFDKKIIIRTKKECFGSNSIYKKLFNKNLYILSLGVQLTHGISEFMHIEKMANVPYRKDKVFRGISISENNHSYKDYAIHFARNEKFFKNFKINREDLENELIKKKIIKKVKYGYGKILLLNGNDFFDYTLNRLNKNVLFMLKKFK